MQNSFEIHERPSETSRTKLVVFSDAKIIWKYMKDLFELLVVFSDAKIL
jgi:hypothetical protein